MQFGIRLKGPCASAIGLNASMADNRKVPVVCANIDPVHSGLENLFKFAGSLLLPRAPTEYAGRYYDVLRVKIHPISSAGQRQDAIVAEIIAGSNGLQS